MVLTVTLIAQSQRVLLNQERSLQPQGLRVLERTSIQFQAHSLW